MTSSPNPPPFPRSEAQRAPVLLAELAEARLLRGRLFVLLREDVLRRPGWRWSVEGKGRMDGGYTHATLDVYVYNNVYIYIIYVHLCIYITQIVYMIIHV